MAAEIKVTVDEKKKVLAIEMPLEDEPQLSKSEKSLTIASTRGNYRSGVRFKGKEITIGVNAYIPNDKKKG